MAPVFAYRQVEKGEVDEAVEDAQVVVLALPEQVDDEEEQDERDEHPDAVAESGFLHWCDLIEYLIKVRNKREKRAVFRQFSE